MKLVFYNKNTKKHEEFYNMAHLCDTPTYYSFCDDKTSLDKQHIISKNDYSLLFVHEE